jgi:uncharacterized protein (TIGR04222 family)
MADELAELPSLPVGALADPTLALDAYELAVVIEGPRLALRTALCVLEERQAVTRREERYVLSREHVPDDATLHPIEREVLRHLSAAPATLPSVTEISGALESNSAVLEVVNKVVHRGLIPRCRAPGLFHFLVMLGAFFLLGGTNTVPALSFCCCIFAVPLLVVLFPYAPGGIRTPLGTRALAVARANRVHERGLARVFEDRLAPSSSE